MKHYNIPLVVVVFNDNAFGNVKRIQQQNYRGRTIASDLTNPDFVALAKSFGIAGMRAEGPDGLQGALREALAAHEPTLIEVPVGEMPSPWRLIMHTL
jgi:acetolactate synthase-1/2/3 large subunit